jgi:putative glutamine amidotransferase
VKNATVLVGVTTYYAEAQWGSLRRRAAVVPAAYFELVARAGARPLLLPPMHSAEAGTGFGASDVVASLDALVLIGGGDVDPLSYGQSPGPSVGGVDPLRDQSERALLAAALARDLPVLAICRGQQLLNVHLGGTLHQHLPDLLGHREHQLAPGVFNDIDVVTVSGTVVSSIFGDKATVHCSHHQSIDRLGDGLVVAAYSVEAADIPGAPDGVIEAVELPGQRFVVGVQWHPEDTGDVRPFGALVQAARS